MPANAPQYDDIVEHLGRLLEEIDAARQADGVTPETYGVLNSLKLMLNQSWRASQLLLRDQIA